MGKVERQTAELEDLLQRSGALRLGEVVRMMDVSVSTVRRLFIRLEERGSAVRVHGGIRLAHPVQGEYSFDSVAHANRDEKERIACAAARLVQPGMSVYLDSGTTLARVCAALARQLQQQPAPGVTLVTNSLENLELLSPFAPVTLVGGLYRGNRRDFCGYLAEESVNCLHFDLCILGTDGYAPGYGFTTTDFQTARLNKCVIARSERTVVAADSSKFPAPSTVQYALPREVSLLITGGLDEEMQRHFAQNGLEVRSISKKMPIFQGFYAFRRDKIKTPCYNWKSPLSLV